MHYLSICSITKNETPYLKEFVAFHRAVGIEKFYFYDNESDIPVKETLKGEIEKGIVKVIDFPGHGKQMPAYTHFIQNYGKETKWAAIIDLDEYLVPQIKDNVPEVLSEYERNPFSAFQVSWRIFGNNDHIEQPEGLIIENYTSASPFTWHENTHTKAIIQPERIIKAGTNPHYCVPKPGYFNVSEDFQEVRNAWTKHSSKKLRLNHYFTKSLEEFKIKISRPRADVASGINGRTLEDFYNFNKYCVEEDISALKFIDKTKEIML